MPVTARSLLALAVVALALAPARSAAQSRTTSALRGTVVTTDGTPVGGAAIQIVRTETGTTRTTVTNAEGGFLFLLLQPGGPYTLTVQQLGFAEEERSGLQLRVGETSVVQVVLQEEALAVEGLDVEVDRADVFNSERVGPGLVMETRVIEQTPLISRDLIQLTELSPMVRSTESGGFSIAGQNDRYNSLLIDGVLNKDVFGSTAGGVPGAQAGARLIPLDAVDQYEVLVAPFDVRLSGFTGGVMNAITKSGTNQFRGRVSAVNRNEAMAGDLVLPSGPVGATGVERSVLGLSLGGPIQQDRIHFFVAGEVERRSQPPTGYNVRREPASVVRITSEAADELTSILSDQYGIEAGEVGPYSLDRSLTNVFARLDWGLSDRHRLTVRNVFSAGENDESPDRTGFEPYGYSSNAVFRKSASNTTSLQLFSDLGSLGANELTLSVQRSTDETTPVGSGGQVEIDVQSDFEGISAIRPVRVGAQYFAQDNDLEQASYRLTNSLTLQNASGSATTLGLTGALHSISHRYLPAADGHWYFASVDNLIENRPYRYERGVLAEGADPAVDFSVLEWGLFAQHQIATEKGLTMRFGIRLDMPQVLDSPDTNVDVLDWFGYETSDLPSGMLMVSPRWGFNWQSDGERRWQVRGGAGLFTGQIPYVWLANAFHNDGQRSVTRICTGRIGTEPPEGNIVPPYVPGTQPDECYGSGGGAAFEEARPVTAFQNGFVYPQELKFSVVADRELGEDLTLSLTGLFSHAINQVVLEEANLDQASGVQIDGDFAGFGGTDRQRFGRPSDQGYQPNRINPDFSQVLLVGNETQDWSFTFAAELRGQLSERIGFQSGYSFSRSYDHMSLVAPDMISNFGYNAVGSDPNNPPLRPSNFDRPHKFILSLFGTPFPGLDRTELVFLYTGESGLPYSYVYRGDANGDGYSGIGQAFDRTNDLIYVPNTASQVPMSPASLGLLSQALESDACLAENRGRILQRNSCRSPWQHRLDLRLSQGLDLLGADVRLEADLINVLNLVNGDWGRIQTTRPVVPLLDLNRRDGSPLSANWGGASLPVRNEDGTLSPTEPWTVVTPDSQWQMQLGLRVGFGGNR